MQSFRRSATKEADIGYERNYSHDEGMAGRIEQNNELSRFRTLMFAASGVYST